MASPLYSINKIVSCGKPLLLYLHTFSHFTNLSLKLATVSNNRGVLVECLNKYVNEDI